MELKRHLMTITDCIPLYCFVVARLTLDIFSGLVINLIQFPFDRMNVIASDVFSQNNYYSFPLKNYLFPCSKKILNNG